MGIRPAPFIEDPCGCEGFTPESGFVISFSSFAKAIVTRMGEDGLSGFVRLRIKRGARFYRVFVRRSERFE